MTAGVAASPQEIAERALAASESDECAVIVDERHTARLRWAGNRVTANGVARSRQLTVVAIVAGRDGHAAGVVSRRGSLGEAQTAVADVVAAADRMASQLGPATDGLPLPPGGPPADWFEPAAELPPAPLRPIAGDLGEAFARSRAEGRSLTGYAQAEVLSTYLATSSGLRRRHVQRADLADLTARANGQTGWTGARATDLRAMDDELATSMRRPLPSVKLPPGRYEVVLSASCVADLMLALHEYAGAQAAADGRTGFSRPGGGTRLGDQLSSRPLTLRSDPHEPGLGCAPFVVARSSEGGASVFDNGLPLRPTRWITDGKLTALVAGRRSAQLTGLAATPPIENLILEGGTSCGPDLIRGVKRGLAISSLWYLREVDPALVAFTGLTRDGVYLIEDGEITGLVNDFRFNESPLHLLEHVIEAGRSEPALPREWGDQPAAVAMPPLHVADFMMSAVAG